LTDGPSPDRRGINAARSASGVFRHAFHQTRTTMPVQAVVRGMGRSSDIAGEYPNMQDGPKNRHLKIATRSGRTDCAYSWCGRGRRGWAGTQRQVSESKNRRTLTYIVYQPASRPGRRGARTVAGTIGTTVAASGFRIVRPDDPRQAAELGVRRAALDRAIHPGCTPYRRVDRCPSVREGRRLDGRDNGGGRCLDRSDDQLSRHSGDGLAERRADAPSDRRCHRSQTISEGSALERSEHGESTVACSSTMTSIPMVSDNAGAIVR
jgi:hypothetical protein